MSEAPTLLPPASTPLERALSRTMGRFSPAIKVSALWNPATCPPAFLPYLAWALSVDEWDHAWGVDKKRAVIAAARYLHQIKGTRAAVRIALESIGQPDATIIERGDYVFRAGTITRDGTHLRAGQGGWATYRVILKQPVTVQQAHQIKRLLAAVQRNCITLTAIDYKQAAISRNGAIHRNGAYARGVVDTTIN